MYYILFYEVIEDYLEKRQKYRSEHLKLAHKELQNGTLIMAGAYAEPTDGAMLIFKGDSPEIAKNFAENDPYVKNGLIKNWYIRNWSVVIGDS